MAKTYGAHALEVALGQVGVKEQPPNSNSGPMVRAYQAATFLGGTGWPWCAAYYNWVYANAGAVQPYRSASVPELLGWFTEHKRLLHRSQVRPGDAVLYDWGGDGIPDHIGIFKRWMNAQQTELEVVEGNTAIGNDSNGGQVLIRLRYVKDVKAFARPVASRVPVGVKFDPLTGAPKRSLVRRIFRGPH